MLPQTFAFILRPFRKIQALETTGRVVWSLLAIDAAVLGLWLFLLNRFVFLRPLDEEDFSTVIAVSLLCYTVTLQYGLRRERSVWWLLGKLVVGQVLAAVVLHYVFVHLGMNLSGRQVLKFFALHLPLHALVRGVYLWCRGTLPAAPLETTRLVLIAGTGFFFYGAFATSGSVGSGDAYWYCIMNADFVSQWRLGVFPVFAGQTEYAFNGAISPLRFAPYLQHFVGGLDLLTGRWLPFSALQNLALLLCGFGGILSAYLCCAAIIPGRRWTALALASLYAGCPGILSLGYQGDLFMSMTTLPYVPLAAYGIWRTLHDDRASILWSVLPLAALWYCHPPIALWLTFIAVFAHLVIWSRRRADKKIYLGWAAGTALFILATGYTFVSVKTLGAGSTQSEITIIIESVRSVFPKMFFPVSDTADQLSDYQLGWGLWLALGLALAGTVWRPRRSELVLMIGGLGLILLLLPIPRFNAALWHLLPATLRDITYHWPMQRFYVILAALTVICTAGVLAKLSLDRRRMAFAVSIVLFACTAWTYREAVRFVIRGFAITVPPTQAGIFLERHNQILTRYAFNPFPSAPPYFSHSYIDPYLENRVLAADRHTELASNVAAARPPDEAAQIPLTAEHDGGAVAVLRPLIPLAPGVRYAMRFEPHFTVSPGSLLVSGEHVRREFFLPNSAVGMVPGTEPTTAFGYMPTSRHYFSVWTSKPVADTVELRYIFNQAVPGVSADFARVYLQPYAIDHLPVKITSWAPYRATTNASAAGAWLETPRLYLPGYVATVNGHPATVEKSPGGLVLVGLQPGENSVTLRYRGPWILRASYYAALATWLVFGVLGLRAFIRKSRATSPAPSPS